MYSEYQDWGPKNFCPVWARIFIILYFRYGVTLFVQPAGEWKEYGCIPFIAAIFDW